MGVERWDEQAAVWDSRPEAHVYADQAFATLVPLVSQEFGGFHELRILDFGAGTGLLTARMASEAAEIVALDLSPKMIEVLREKIDARGWNTVVALCGELASSEVLQDEAMKKPFDLIVASSVCSFLPDFQAELGRLSSRLRPGGLFVQWDWHGDGGGDWADGFLAEDLLSAYDGAGLESLFAKVGFVFSFEDKELEVLQGVAHRR